MTDRDAWERHVADKLREHRTALARVGTTHLDPPTPKPNKFHAKKTTVDGVTFDSAGEARRWQELVLLQLSGAITRLVSHEKFPLVVRGKAVTSWRPDYSYEENGVRIVEDFKSNPTRTEAYRIRVKLFAALYPTYQIRESER
jgi:hypothetical protein